MRGICKPHAKSAGLQFITSVFLIFFLVGCGSTAPTDTSSDNLETQSSLPYLGSDYGNGSPIPYGTVIKLESAEVDCQEDPEGSSFEYCFANNFVPYLTDEEREHVVVDLYLKCVSNSLDDLEAAHCSLPLRMAPRTHDA